MPVEDLAVRVALAAMASLGVTVAMLHRGPASAPARRETLALRVETLGGPMVERTVPALHLTDEGDEVAWWLQTGGYADARCTFAAGRCDTGDLRACVEWLSAARARPIPAVVFHPSDASTACNLARRLESLEGLGVNVRVSTRAAGGVSEPADTPAAAPVCVPARTGWLGASSTPLDEREAQAGGCHARCEARSEVEACLRVCLAAERVSPAVDY